MGAYDNIDPAIAGLKSGLDAQVESWKAAEELPFGSGVFGYIGDSLNAYLYKLDTSTTTFDADIVTGNSVVATVNGTAVTAVPFNSTHDLTMADLVTQIEADITGAEATLTDTGGTNRVIAVFIKGVDVVVTWSITGGGSQAGDTVVVTSVQIFVGVTIITHIEYAGTASYKQYDAANVMIEGEVYALTDAAVNANTAAYITTTNRIFGTSGYDTKCRFRSTLAAAGLALVEVRGQN